METKRYRLKIATWTVVRAPGLPSPRKLDSPEAVIELARDLLRDQDDDKEHFWAILLNAQNRYLLGHLVSTGTQSATLVHPRLCAATHNRGYVAVAVMWCSGGNSLLSAAPRSRNAT